MNLRSILFLCIGILILHPLTIFAQSGGDVSAKDLTKLSFDELLRVEIKSASLTGIEIIKTPSAITIITAEEIGLTPHRDLLDLLEVYVPGFSFVNHWQGPRMGLRGVMGDQNYSYLLLVNGENINMQAGNGAIFEIQSKNLTDIEKIEIMRGSGSVIHGPGAIGGVISITTKKAKNDGELNIGAKHNLTYRFSNIHGNYSKVKENYSAYLSASIGVSKGIKTPEFYYVDRAHGYGYGYMSSTWGNKDLGSPAPNFYANFQEQPEVKVQLDIDFLKEFNFWARYTDFSFIKQQQQTASQEGPAFPGMYGRQFTSALKNDHRFSDVLQLVSSISFQSQSHGDIQLYQSTAKPFDDITQRRYSFAENKLNARTILNYQMHDKLEIAAGIEYSYWFYSPEWGKSKSEFLMDFPQPILFAVLDSSSGFYEQYNDAGIVTVVEQRINAAQGSAFIELNYQPGKNTALLFSGRMDKHRYADIAFSPRVSIIQQVHEDNYLKLIAQQSVRLPAFSELYAIDFYSGAKSEPEKIRSVELIFSRIQNQKLLFNTSVFFQSIDQIAWLANDRSGLTGTYESLGFEFELSYETNKLKLDANYSYVLQLDWRPVVELNSYLSNMGIDSIDVPLLDAGNNRINNVPVHQLKFSGLYLINQSWKLQLNGRFATGYGQMDMLNMYRDAHMNYGAPHTVDEMNNIYDDLDDRGYAKPSFTSNLRIGYTHQFEKASLSISAMAMNLISINHKRYVYQYWEAGNNRQYPRQVGFVEEPLSLGFEIQLEF